MGRLSQPPAHPHPEPGVNRNAYDMLRARKIPVEHVVRVCPDSILYVGSNARPMTAWLSYGAGELEVCCESGFAAEPSAWVLGRLGPLHNPDGGYLRAADVPLAAENAD